MESLRRRDSEGGDKRLKKGSGNCWVGTLFHKVSGVEGRAWHGVSERNKNSKKMSKEGKKAGKGMKRRWRGAEPLLWRWFITFNPLPTSSTTLFHACFLPIFLPSGGTSAPVYSPSHIQDSELWLDFLMHRVILTNWDKAADREESFRCCSCCKACLRTHLSLLLFLFQSPEIMSFG